MRACPFFWMAAMLTIVTHNAYWFQAHPTLWPEERARAVPEVLDALAGVYAAQQPDLVCLQEVPDEQAARALAQRLGMAYVFAPGRVRREYGSAVLTPLAAAEVSVVTDQLGPAERSWLRAVVPTDDGEDFSVMAAHLPSNRFAPFEQAELQRVAELRCAMAAFGQADVVMGDFNSRAADAPCQFMREQGYVDASDAAGKAELKARFDVRVDYIWVREAVADRVVDYWVLGPEQCSADLGGQRRCLSDHLPQVVVLASGGGCGLG